MRVQLALTLFFVSFILCTGGCRKDEDVCPSEPTPAADGRDRFVGTYNVFDTIGTYLYQLTIVKFGSGNRDSLLLMNFADTFDLKILHEDYWTTDYLSIFPGFGVQDQAGNSWALWGGAGTDGSNVLMNDTIPLAFTQSNIAFYFAEGVPYYSCVCKQIAVKQ